MITYEKKYPGQMDQSVSLRELESRAFIRKAAAEGMVLLENNGILPLKEGAKIALYGGAAIYPVKGGTGSGSVNSRSIVSLDEGLRNAGFELTTEDWITDYRDRYETAHENWRKGIIDYVESQGNTQLLYSVHASHPFQMPAGAPVTKTNTDTAVYVICRISGEGADRKLDKGDYYLSDTEEEELKALRDLYENLIVVLNIGGIIDMKYIDSMKPEAVLLMSQAGMESGNSAADILSGKVNPSGKLTDTWAVNYEDYPGAADFSYLNGNLIEEKYNEGIFVGYRYFDAVKQAPRYPFGYGLSYTTFAYSTENVLTEGNKVEVSVKVTNTGKYAGKEVIQLYACLPGGKRRKEIRRLAAFKKTGLLEPGASEVLTLTFPLYGLASYNTAKAAYYLEQGDYYLTIGNSSENTDPAAILNLKETVYSEKLPNICELHDKLHEMEMDESVREGFIGQLKDRSKDVICLSIDSAAETCFVFGESLGAKDPMNSPEIRKKAEELTARLSCDEKAELCCGQIGKNSKEIIGAAAVHVPGAAGETCHMLYKYGVGSVVLADGPAGLRLSKRYEEFKKDGTVYNMTRYESLQNRFFGTEFTHEDTIDHYQFCSAIPIGLLLAQTFDTDLMVETGKLIGREMEEFGVGVWLAPGMNIHRNPLCGRNYEYYSEDPVVAGKMAGAITRGVQSVPGLSVTIKHFACNNQENNRFGVSSIVSEQALREIYLKGFEIAVREDAPRAVMTSYNRVNGIHSANSYDLCTEALRREWGFGGIVMTDWATTLSVGGSSAVKCITAGNDLIMPGNISDITEITGALKDENDFHLDEAELDACCVRNLSFIMTSLGFEE